MTMGEGMKNRPKLRDVIYAQPLVVLVNMFYSSKVQHKKIEKNLLWALKIGGLKLKSSLFVWKLLFKDLRSN